MKKRFFILSVLAIVHACIAGELPKTIAMLRVNGAFGFPQNAAKVLCDRPTLRFSVWNDDKYLFAQAILWTDNDVSFGKDNYNRLTYDWSFLMLNVNPDGKVTPGVDREYVLNPGPPGLYYVVDLGKRFETGMYDNSEGHGAIRYINMADGKLVRVDTYLIPLTEISRSVGDKLRLAYWGFSPKPPLTVNSTSFTNEGKSYNRWGIPLSQYNDYFLTENPGIDLTAVPEGRKDTPAATAKVGTAAPQISAKEWINTKKPLTQADLRGKIVVVDFWGTWCTSCIEDIPHLNELQHKYSGRNFQLVSLVREGRQTMDPFLAKHHVGYPIGLESGSLDDYGITSLPQAFVIDQTGKIIWSGDTASPEMDKAIVKAMGL